MSDNQTKATTASVDQFIGNVEPAQQQADCRELIEMMRKATTEEPVMWGSSIVGFGHGLMTYASGREVEWFSVGFAPRKLAISLYLLGATSLHEEQLANLGKHTTGKGCIYVKKLADVDKSVLAEMLEMSVEFAKSEFAAT